MCGLQGLLVKQSGCRCDRRCDRTGNSDPPPPALLAQDDPFVGEIPVAQCAANPHTLLAVTARGGHVAFLQGLWPLGTAYMDTAVTQFLGSVLKLRAGAGEGTGAGAGAGTGAEVGAAPRASWSPLSRL